MDLNNPNLLLVTGKSKLLNFKPFLVGPDPKFLNYFKNQKKKSDLFRTSCPNCGLRFGEIKLLSAVN